MLISHSIYVIAYCHLKNLFMSSTGLCLWGCRNITGYLCNTVWFPYNWLHYFTVGYLWQRCVYRTGYHKITFISGYNKKLFDTIWQPSQTVERLVMGSVIMTLKAHLSNHFIAWYVGLTGRVEVLEPEILRDKVLEKLNYWWYTSRKHKQLTNSDA